MGAGSFGEPKLLLFPNINMHRRKPIKGNSLRQVPSPQLKRYINQTITLKASRPNYTGNGKGKLKQTIKVMQNLLYSGLEYAQYLYNKLSNQDLILIREKYFLPLPLETHCRQ